MLKQIRLHVITIGDVMNRIKLKSIDLILSLLAVFLVGFVLGNYNWMFYNEQAVREDAVSYAPLDIPADGHKVEMLIPAVDAEGKGVTAKLTTSVRPGTGLVLVAVNNILAEYSTQYSGRIAARAAGNYTNIDMNSFDVIYTVDVNATAIEGPSAGSAMAVSIIAALENRILPESIMTTGTINSDGTIGQVGSIIEKARAAKERGAKMFLVPKNQSSEYSDVSRERSCRNEDSVEYCTVNYTKNRVNIGEELGIEVVEVSNIGEAVRHFFSESSSVSANA